MACKFPFKGKWGGAEEYWFGAYFRDRKKKS